MILTEKKKKKENVCLKTIQTLNGCISTVNDRPNLHEWPLYKSKVDSNILLSIVNNLSIILALLSNHSLKNIH